MADQMQINRLRLAVFWASIALVAYFTTAQHMQLSADFFSFNDDARQQIWPMLRYTDAALFPNDYVADYYLRAFLPSGYSILYQALAQFIDPRLISKVLPYLLLFVTVVSIGFVSWRLGGPAAAWITAAIVFTAEVYLAEMTGGLPRSFAFPLVALLIVGVASGRPLVLSAVTVAGAMFYYVVSAVGGMLLFVYLLIIPSSWRGTARSWTLKRRLIVLCITGITCVGVVLPGYYKSQSFGPLLTQEHVLDFPEAGVGGRYAPVDLPIAKNAVLESIHAGALTFGGGRAISSTFYKAGKAGRQFIAVSILAVLLVGLAIMWRRDVATKRLILVPLIAIIGYYAAEWLAPYLFLPYRYLVYTMPLFVATIFPAAMLILLRHIPKLSRMPAIGTITAVSVLGLILLFGGGPRATRGLTVRVQDHSIYATISRLPTDAVVAGWPTGAVENVPYLTERTAFLTYETHQAFHKTYTLEMRRRMEALIDAYFSLDTGALKVLNEEFGVTHLVLNREHLAGVAPDYFKPFDKAIRIARSKETEFSTAERIMKLDNFVEYRDANLILVNIGAMTCYTNTPLGKGS